MCYSDPASHPFIKPTEREYLEREMGSIVRNDNLPPTPWKAILTSMPMIALVCAQIGHDWGFYIMVTDLPKYMSDVMQFSIKANGLYSSLPYVMMWIFSISSGFVGDWLMTRGILNITNTRKLMTGIGKCFVVFKTMKFRMFNIYFNEHYSCLWSCYFYGSRFLCWL